MTEGKQHWVVQLVQSSFVKQNYQYLPYAAGLLQAYVLRHATDLSRYVFLPILLDRNSVAETIGQIGLADVFAFSTYVWSYQYNLALARAVKARKPEALVIFGGPQVPDRAEDFLRENPCIDVCVHGEGEITFFKLLESLPDKDWETIPGISWIDAGGQFHSNARAPRQQDLDVFPSPYVMGLFDELVKKHDYYWVALWETNRGCPFSCSFCDWGSNVASKVYRFGMERLKQEMEWFGRSKMHTINCCDANFGILPRDVEITDYMVDVHQRTGHPQIWFVQGAKNAIERSYEINKKIIGAGMGDMVTLSLQSVTPLALESIRRDNISLKAFREMQERCKREGINTYTDFLVGLPGETYDSFIDGIDQVMNEGQHHLVNFFNVYVLPNAEINQPEYRQKHGLVTVRNPHLEHCYPVEAEPEVQEWSEMVIGSNTFTREDWVKMRVIAWWIDIIYMLRKAMQLPLLLVHMLTGLSFRQIFEFYAFGELKGTPILSNLQQFLLRKAEGVSLGEPELCAVRNVKEPFWLAVTDFVLTGLTPVEVRNAFYLEQKKLLEQLLALYHKKMPEGLLDEALALNEALIDAYAYQRPFALPLRYNVWEATSAFLRGQPWELRTGMFHHIHDWSGAPHFDVRVETGQVQLVVTKQASSFK
ncbi:MAG: radical SAM protein [Candidatus Sericytochromatia bacterium]